MRPDPAILDELVRRVVAAVRPLRIILFGSGARGDMRPDSDIDLLVVMPEGTHRLHTAMDLYRKVRVAGVSKDFVVVTESDVQRYADNRSLVIHNALRDGVEIYRAAPAPVLGPPAAAKGI